MNGFAARASLFLIALSAPLCALADSQTGGLPSVADRVTVLESSVTTLTAALTTLQTALATVQTSLTSLQTTVVKLQSDNTALQSQLTAEIAKRIAGDTSLQTALDVEIIGRVAADLSFQNSLAAESGARQNADAALNSLIQGLQLGAKVFTTSVGIANVPNGDLTKVATLPLAAGRYLVTAKGEASNFNHTADWGCYLSLNGADPRTGNFDQALIITESIDLNAQVSSVAFSLAGVITLAAPGQVNMHCESGQPSSEIDDIKLIALQVI